MLGRRSSKNQPVGRTRPIQSERSGKVFSYYASGSNAERTTRERNRSLEIPSLRAPIKTADAQRLKYGIGIAVVFVLLFVNTFVNVSAKPHITTLADAGEARVLQDKQIYEQAIQHELQSSLANRTKLTINTTKISAALLKQYPELDDVRVSLPLFGQKPHITLVPSAGVFTFTASNGSSYVINSRGATISTNTAAFDTLVPIMDQSGLKVEMAEQALPQNDVVAMNALVEQLQYNHFKVASLTLPRSSREVDVRLKDKPYVIKFSLEGNTIQQAGAYVAVQQKLDSTKITPKQYIDARVGDRVYYK
jgi:cell division septal protein FtsQ